MMRSTCLLTRVLPLAALGLAGSLLSQGTMAHAQSLPASLFTATGAIGAPEEAMRLRRLPITSARARLNGEYDRLTIPVYLTAREAAGRASLQLGIETAISVMPEASVVEIAVNDRPIGQSQLAGSGMQRRLIHEVPAGILGAGWNVITISARQRHRVDCSTAATYELWSQIDPQTTGLLLAATDPGLASLSDLAALGAGPDGRHHLRAVLPEGASAENVEQAVRALATVALRLGLQDPVVELAHTTGIGAGLDLVYGPRAALGQMGAEVVPDEGSLAIRGASSGERFQLVIAASGPQAGAQALDILSRLPLAETASVPLALPGDSLSFAQLGEISREFDGRLFESRFELKLPSDFLPSDVGRVAVRLSGGYAPGLDPDSRLTVRVNGEVAGALGLGRESGEVFSERAIYVSLAAFRPGVNTVEVEAQLTNGDDEVCLPTAMLSNDTRFLILDESRIEFPRYPRIARIPRLTQGFQLDVTGEGQPVAIHVPHPDLRSVSAAATLFTRLALDLGTVDPLSLSFRAPEEDEQSAIIVGSLDAIPVSLATLLRLPRVQLAQAWAAPVLAARAATPTPLARSSLPLEQRVARIWTSMPADPILTGSIRQPSARGESGIDLRAEWSQRLNGDGPLDGIMRRLRSFIPQSASHEEGIRLEELGPSSGLIIQQVPAPAGGAFTVIAAANPERLELAMQAVTLPDLWSKLEGASVVYDEIDQTIHPIAMETPVRFMPTQPGSISNWRLVAAGLFSAHPWLYTLCIVLLSMLTAGLAGRWLKTAGQQP